MLYGKAILLHIRWTRRRHDLNQSNPILRGVEQQRTSASNLWNNSGHPGRYTTNNDLRTQKSEFLTSILPNTQLTASSRAVRDIEATRTAPISHRGWLLPSAILVAAFGSGVALVRMFL